MRQRLSGAGGVGCLGGGGTGALLPGCHLQGGEVGQQRVGVIILAMLMVGLLSLDADRDLGDGLQRVVRTGLAASLV